MQWIGIHVDKGYVILDRDLPANKPGKSRYYFINCTDWTIFEDDKANWKKPMYTFTNDTSEAIQYLAEYKTIYKDKIWLPLLEKVFNKRRKESGYPDAKLIKSSKHRSSHCWYCKGNVDNAVDYECSLCRWIVCSVCGSCKLGGC